MNGVYCEPAADLSVRVFASSLLARAIAYAKTGR
jgi:hypothetical protein